MSYHYVEYSSGPARDEARFGEGAGVDYMMVSVDGVELYSEIIPEPGYETDTYDLLKDDILDQAAENGIDPEDLEFPLPYLNYEQMRLGENLSWCTPFVRAREDTYFNGYVTLQKHDWYIQNEGVVVSTLINGTTGDGKQTDLDYISAHDDWVETGCSECPFRHGCEAMRS